MHIQQTNAFAPRVGEAFDVVLAADATAPLTLVEVSPLPAHKFPGMLRDPFSLMFRSPSPVVMPQKIYRLKNEAMGALDIFLVPVGRDQHGTIYQAVFN
jgi:hypothetical protein